LKLPQNKFSRVHKGQHTRSSLFWDSTQHRLLFGKPIYSV